MSYNLDLGSAGTWNEERIFPASHKKIGFLLFLKGQLHLVQHDGTIQNLAPDRKQWIQVAHHGFVGHPLDLCGYHYRTCQMYHNCSVNYVIPFYQGDQMKLTKKPQK